MVAIERSEPLRVRIIEGELVGREVVGPQVDGRIEGPAEGVGGLTRDIHEQVESHRPEPGAAGLGHGVRHVRRSMTPTQPPKLQGIQALGAQAEPGDAGTTEAREVAALGGAGVGLEGDLRVRARCRTGRAPG